MAFTVNSFPIGAANTAPVNIVLAAHNARVVRIYNVGTSTAWIGDDDITRARGVRLDPLAEPLVWNQPDPLYAISLSGTVLTVLEEPA